MGVVLDDSSAGLELELEPESMWEHLSGADLGHPALGSMSG